MTRNEALTVDPGPVATQGNARQHNGRTLLVLALAAALILGIAGVVMTRDDVTVPNVPAPITQDQPEYTGDWKDYYIGQTSTTPAYTGDGKDSLIGQ